MGVVGTLYVCSCSTFLCMSTAHIPPSSFLFFAPSLTSFFPPSSLLSLPFLPSPSSPLLTSSFPLSLSLSLPFFLPLSPSKVCIHISRCYRVSAQFEACREAITEIPNIVKDTCRVLYYKVCDIQWLHHDDITGTMISP